MADFVEDMPAGKRPARSIFEGIDPTQLWLRGELIRLGLTRKAFAKLAGVSPSGVAKWMNGHSTASARATVSDIHRYVRSKRDAIVAEFSKQPKRKVAVIHVEDVGTPYQGPALVAAVEAAELLVRKGRKVRIVGDLGADEEAA